MTFRCLTVCCAALAVALVAAQPAPATQADGVTATLRASLTVFGGEERVRAIRSLTVRGRGEEFSTEETLGRPTAPPIANEHEETISIDVPGRRAADEYRTHRGDGSYRWRRFIYEPSGRTVGDFTARRIYSGPTGDVPEDRRRVARRTPPLILLELLDHLAHVTARPDAHIDGRRCRVLEYSVPGRQAVMQIVIDASTNRLWKVTQAVDYPGLGDGQWEWVYDDYQQTAGLGAYPRGHSIRLANAVYRTVRYHDVRVDDAQDTLGVFTLPADMPVPPPRPAPAPAPSAARPPAPAEPGPREPVAPGVHIVPLSNGDVGLLVEFRDFLLAAEPSARLPILSDIPVDDRPGSSSVSEAFIERIKTIAPGKPIRYVVPTHHHADHAGGVRAFFAEGATLLTTPANLPFFEAVVRAPARGVPDRFSRTNPRVNIEVVKGRRTITDGTRVVELIDAGPNPHTDEILVLYLPGPNILFQGDLFYYSGEQGFPDPNRRVIMTAFATWLRAQKLAPARIYGTHMVGFATMEHVNRVLATGSSR